MQALARAAGRGQRKEMAVAARQTAAREARTHVGLPEGAGEALQRGTDGTGGIGIAGGEALLQRAVARQDVAGRHAEGHEVVRTIEAIDERVETAGVARRLELTH